MQTLTHVYYATENIEAPTYYYENIRNYSVKTGMQTKNTKYSSLPS
jgi:hypothetical protein